MMEENFSLLTKRQLYPFFDEASERRLKGMFLYNDERLVQSVQLILGKGFEELKHGYCTNMDIYSLIMAWGLDLGEPVEMVKGVMEALVHKDFLEGMDSILEWAIPREGMDICEGIEYAKSDEVKKCIMFVRWPEGRLKAR